MSQNRLQLAHTWPGFLLIGLGALFLLDNLGYLHFARFTATWWPSILILAGVGLILTGRVRTWFGPAVLVFLGVMFQLSQLDVIEWWSWRTMWPVLLIALGVWCLLVQLRTPPAAAPAPSDDAGEVLSANVIAGDVERTVTSTNFRGGEATAVLSELKLDLRRAHLAPGEQRLNVTAILASVEVRVPDNWRVVVDGAPVLGEIEDHRAPATEPAAGTFRVHGFSMLASISVKS